MDNIPLGLSIGTGCGLSIGIAIGNSTYQHSATPEYKTIREKRGLALAVIGLVLLVATFATFLLVNSYR